MGSWALILLGEIYKGFNYTPYFKTWQNKQTYIHNTYIHTKRTVSLFLPSLFLDIGGKSFLIVQLAVQTNSSLRRNVNETLFLMAGIFFQTKRKKDKGMNSKTVM